MSRRLIFTRQSKQDVNNKYVVGSGVSTGFQSRAVRAALKRRASNSIGRGPDGKAVWKPCVGFCPVSQRAIPVLPRPSQFVPSEEDVLVDVSYTPIDGSGVEVEGEDGEGGGDGGGGDGGEGGGGDGGGGGGGDGGGGDGGGDLLLL